MVPRCSATWRAECKRVRPSNRGPATHVEVSPISDSNESMVGFPATSESNDLMAGSCRSCTAMLLAISIPRFCVTQVPPHLELELAAIQRQRRGDYGPID